MPVQTTSIVEPLEPRLCLSTHRHHAPLPVPDHVIIVMEENHSYNDLFGSTAARRQIPYLRTLAAHGALFTNSFAITHPSQPNYLALFSGSTQGITDDNFISPGAFTGPDLGGELIAAGRTIGGYFEGLPRAGFTGETSNFYDKKHNPLSDFADVPTRASVPFTTFSRASRLSSLPTVSFVVPNENDNMHDGTPAAADSWLKNHLSAYVTWAQTHNSLLIVTWDEDDASGNNQIPTLFVGPMVKPGTYAETITHYNVLRTIEDMYSLPQAGATVRDNPITDVWNATT